MRITFQMSDGSAYAFDVAEGAATEKFLANFNYWEIFDRPNLRVHDGKSTWAFNPARIEMIHFATPGHEMVSAPENILSAKCVTAESYRRSIAVEDRTARPAMKDPKEGDFFRSALAITLTSGHEEYLDLFLMLRSERERRANLYDLFHKVTYTIPCESGGCILFNPRHIVCIHMHPSLSEDRDNVWLVEKFAGATGEPR